MVTAGTTAGAGPVGTCGLQHGLAPSLIRAGDLPVRAGGEALRLLYEFRFRIYGALPHFAEGATIIDTSSIQAMRPGPELADYAMTKAAIVNFAKSTSAALAKQGVRFNAVAPGPIWTPLIPATMPAENVKAHGDRVPLGRTGQPAECAPAYVFLASQESSYITGEVLGVTGGLPTH